MPAVPRLFIIAHAPLASALKAVGAHLLPDAAADVVACDVSCEQPVEAVESQVAALFAGLGNAEVLVLTDAFAATPCNVAAKLAERPGTRVLAGVNVPMLWRALAHLQEPLDELVRLAEIGGTEGVRRVVTTRPQNQVHNPASHDPIDDHGQQ